MILVPAYGRDYKTAAEVKADWEAGKDFKIADVLSEWNGAYTSIRDTKEHLGDAAYSWSTEHSYIRYNKLTQLTFIGKWEEAEDYDTIASEGRDSIS